ncbi:killer toxin [Rhypophila decipiens]|uniref:Killer toxin n=1 Tax=Rhypophila decipiens TaxID=261697 RepID=A0AAN6XZ31_9PEZI|nr:killer toxin [Rhypophila decipiens]
MFGNSFSQHARAAVFLLLTATAQTNALGINCRGSGLCDFFLNTAISGNEAKVLSDWIQGISAEGYTPPVMAQNRMYKNGEQIACYIRSSICAFVQNAPGDTSLADIRRLAPEIPGHKCKVCGSVPTGYPGNNDVKHGQLTFNYVKHSCGNGIC